MGWSHEYTVTLPGTPAGVFEAFTSGEAVQGWLAEYAHVEPHQGGAYTMWGRFTPGCPIEATARDRIIALTPGTHLAFSWRFLDVPSTVQVDLSDEGDKTKLRLHHRLDGALGLTRAREYVDDWWRLSLANLDAWLRGAGLCRVDLRDPAPEVRLSIDIAAPRTAVFRALLEPGLVNQWIAKSASIEPRVGGRYDLGWVYEVDGRSVTGGTTRILEMVENERLVLDWLDWRGDTSVTGQIISFTLEELGSQTRVHFRHAGFVRPVDISDYAFGWQYFLDQLAAVPLT